MEFQFGKCRLVHPNLPPTGVSLSGSTMPHRRRLVQKVPSTWRIEEVFGQAMRGGLPKGKPLLSAPEVPAALTRKWIQAPRRAAPSRCGLFIERITTNA